MGSHRLRLLVCAGAALGLILASGFGSGWFTVRIDGLDLSTMGVPTVQASQLTDNIHIDLRAMTMCTNGVCVSTPLGKLGGFYPALATATFWASVVLAVIVAMQAMSRMFRDVAIIQRSQPGYLLAVVCFGAALLAGYLFAPETQSVGELGVHVTRTWGPAMMLLGCTLSVAALWMAVAPSEDNTVFTPLVPATTMTTMRVAPLPSPAVARTPTAPIQRVTAVTPPDVARTRTPSSIPFADPSATPATPGERPSPRELVLEHPLHGKLKYVAATVDVTRAGIDARREDGVAKLVLWADVVGVVARRLPADAPYNGETFVDVVSSAGSTLRLVAWTRWNGDPIAGEGEERARSIVQLVATRCPDAQLDAATRTFLGSHGHAAQLPELATLAQHDQRLA